MLTIGKPLADMNLSELGHVRIAPFLLRLAICIALAAGAMALILTSHGWLTAVGIVALGLIYAHAVELQHQALHNTALPSKSWNRIVGFLLGLPMLVSYSDYQYSHLRHHRLLGTKDDREFFNYGYDHLTSLKPLVLHLLMARHYRDVTVFIAQSLVGRTKQSITKRDSAEHVRAEYQLMAVFLATMAAITIYAHTGLFLKVWLLPLLIAVPAHALIELPEHWGRDHGTLDVVTNTRTIRASWLGYWFTNGNNYHIEHHWLPAVPNDRFPEVHGRIADQIQVDTYPGFYWRFLQELFRNTFSSRGEAEKLA